MNLSIKPLQEWGLPFEKKFLVAGPCSAESEEQLLETARGLADSSVGFIRAGIWEMKVNLIRRLKNDSCRH